MRGAVDQWTERLWRLKFQPQPPFPKLPFVCGPHLSPLWPEAALCPWGQISPPLSYGFPFSLILCLLSLSLSSCPVPWDKEISFVLRTWSWCILCLPTLVLSECTYLLLVYVKCTTQEWSIERPAQGRIIGGAGLVKSPSPWVALQYCVYQIKAFWILMVRGSVRVFY